VGGDADGDTFGISGTAQPCLSPDVAWGPLDGNYLVAWSEYKSAAPGHYRIVVTHVYDTEQGTGIDERQHEPMFLIDPNEWEDHQDEPAVAYNPQCGDQGRYLVTFHFLTADQDIGAQRVWGSGMAVVGSPFLVASTGSVESFPRVASDGHLDQFMVTYTTQVYEMSTWYSALHGRLIKGTHDGGGSGQWHGPAFQIYQSPHTESDSNLGQGDVVGSPYHAGYAALWHDGHLDGDDDTYGQLFKPDLVYLPCVMRNH
jgi:hypothetical protein